MTSERLDYLAKFPKPSDIGMWFVHIPGQAEGWRITTVDQGEELGTLNGHDSPLICIPDGSPLDAKAILGAFTIFKSCPEYLIHVPVSSIESLTQDALVEAYEARLAGSIFASTGYKIEEANVRINRAIDWLRSTDFYACPGSTQYHDSEPCGLLRHSLRVFNHTLELLHTDSFSSTSLPDAVLVALVHDWCKIGLYEHYFRNVKDDATGKWSQVDAYRRNQKGVTLGHGVSSMFLASKFFKLTSEQSIAIRWHMGRWNVAENEVDELQKSNEAYPMVHLVQFADCLSITAYANKQ